MAIVKLNDKRINTIPTEFVSNPTIYINVGELNLSNNLFESIPDSIKLFSSLKKLNLSSNKLTAVNSKLFELKNLEMINFNSNSIQSIPDEISNLTKLTSLEVCANKISSFTFNLNVKRLDLSANFFTNITMVSTTLTFLDISQNDLTSFPVLDCPNLEKINASYNNITSIPDQITNLVNLKSLDLKNNLIKNLPRSFCLLTSLSLLQLDNNPISEVPINFETLKIKKLFVSKTKSFLFKPISTLKELHYSSVGADLLFDDFTSLKQLETLNVSWNMFRELHMSSARLVFLNASHNKLTKLSITKDCPVQRIIARHNELSSIDDSLITSSKIGLLDVSNNRLTSFPSKIDTPMLYQLSIGFNHINSLDIEFNKITNLTMLDISFNGIKSIPSTIGALTALKTFYVTGNQLMALPNEVSNLVSLTNFHLSHNKFQSFPNVILELKNLVKLFISNNHLENIPEINVLQNLHTLDISNCYIQNVNTINNLPKLEQLNLSNNYLRGNINLNGCTALAYVDLSYNSLQQSFDATPFPNLLMLDLSFNDIIEAPKKNPQTVVRMDGCVYIQHFPYLQRFNFGQTFKKKPTTCATTQMCADRDEMQDSFICIPHFAAPEHYLFAAVDGHSGRHVSYVFSQRFPDIFYKMLECNGGSLSIEEALYQSFDAIQNEFSNDPECIDGAVATVVFMTPTSIYTAQCGDCRAVYLTHSGIVQLAPEHKTSDRTEQIRIRGEGGFVAENMRVCGLLVARSVGDVKNKPIITHQPDITCYERRSDEEYIILATDGIWDEISNHTVHAMLHSHRRIFRTSELVGLIRDTAYVSCIAGQNPDNIGVVLCRF